MSKNLTYEIKNQNRLNNITKRQERDTERIYLFFNLNGRTQILLA